MVLFTVEVVCNFEDYHPVCPNGDIVFINSADYGRMQIGRCVSSIGCSGDVLPILDKLCSGRQRCTLRIPNADMNAVVSCDHDMTKYLEATHECLRGRSLIYTFHFTCLPIMKWLYVFTYISNRN